MRVLVFGARGQVGAEIVSAVGPFAEVIALGRDDAPLESSVAIRGAIASASPHVIVNAAAMTDVDAAEADEETANAVNGHAVAVMGDEAKRRRALLIHFSSDFVFDGLLRRPYTEDATPAPLSAYGRSKLLGERLLAAAMAPAIVFRTAWVYGLRRRSFVRSILVAARREETLRVVDDQVGSPTSARDLGTATALLLYAARPDPFSQLAGARGVYHLAGQGQASRYELATAALELDPCRPEHIVRRVDPIPSSERPQAAARPSHAPLDCSQAARRFGLTLPPWRESLRRTLADVAAANVTRSAQ